MYEFSNSCTDIKTKIYARLSSNALLLRNGSAFFETEDYMTRDKWKNFVFDSKIDKNLPGIQGLGYSKVILKEDLKKHTEDVRREGFSDYKVTPEGERDVYTSIIYLEPFSGKNLRAFGYDMFTESVRRAAMEQARDSDVSMLSGKVKLVQETESDVQAGTLMYVPVFDRNMPSNNVEQRRNLKHYS